MRVASFPLVFAPEEVVVRFGGVAGRVTRLQRSEARETAFQVEAPAGYPGVVSVVVSAKVREFLNCSFDFE